jgi:hypothetical protein
MPESKKKVPDELDELIQAIRKAEALCVSMGMAKECVYFRGVLAKYDG